MKSRRGIAAGRLQSRLSRRFAAVRTGRQSARRHLCLRADHHLSRARGAIRELARSAGHHGLVPMAISGALLPLFFGVATINIYTQVGLVTLIGLISKHGILMVEFAMNCRFTRNWTVSRRSRRPRASVCAPILMTTAAMVTGLDSACHRLRRGRGEPLLDRYRRRFRHVDRHAVHALRPAGGLHRAGEGSSRVGRVEAREGNRRARANRVVINRAVAPMRHRSCRPRVAARC